MGSQPQVNMRRQPGHDSISNELHHAGGGQVTAVPFGSCVGGSKPALAGIERPRADTVIRDFLRHDSSFKASSAIIKRFQTPFFQVLAAIPRMPRYKSR